MPGKPAALRCGLVIGALTVMLSGCSGAGGGTDLTRAPQASPMAERTAASAASAPPAPTPEDLPTANTSSELAAALECQDPVPGSDAMMQIAEAQSATLCVLDRRKISIVVWSDHATALRGLRTLHQLAEATSGQAGKPDWRCFGKNWSIGDDNTLYDNVEETANQVQAKVGGHAMTTQDYLAAG